MQVNFKGLYKIPGSWENAKGNGDTMSDISSRKLQSFLEDTQCYMEPDGYSYMNKKNNDVYLTVKCESEPYFEEKVDDYNIDCYKVADNIATNSNLCEKFNTRLRQRKIENIENFDMKNKYANNINKYRANQLNIMG